MTDTPAKPDAATSDAMPERLYANRNGTWTLVKLVTWPHEYIRADLAHVSHPAQTEQNAEAQTYWELANGVVTAAPTDQYRADALRQFNHMLKGEEIDGEMVDASTDAYDWMTDEVAQTIRDAPSQPPAPAIPAALMALVKELVEANLKLIGQEIAEGPNTVSTYEFARTAANIASRMAELPLDQVQVPEGEDAEALKAQLQRECPFGEVSAKDWDMMRWTIDYLAGLGVLAAVPTKTEKPVQGDGDERDERVALARAVSDLSQVTRFEEKSFTAYLKRAKELKEEHAPAIALANRILTEDRT